MAKSGVDYFPLDDTLNDNFKLIEAEFGLTGFGVVVKLYQKIYGGRGYYTEWTNEVALLFAREIGLGGNAVSEIQCSFEANEPTVEYGVKFTNTRTKTQWLDGDSWCNNIFN